VTEQVSGLAQGQVWALEQEQGSARVPVSAQARGLEQVLAPGQVPEWAPARVWVPAPGRALALGPVQE